MVQKFYKFIKDDMSVKCFWIFFYLCLIFLSAWRFTNWFDTDMYWIIATGREILDQGIFHDNVFTIIENADIVVQQWLYAVIVSFIFDTFGNIGMMIFNGFIYLSMISLMILLLHKCYHVNLHISSIVAFITGFFYSYSNARPEMFTICLLLLQCYFVEMYLQTNLKRYLYFLPLCTLLEINGHGSLWIIHFVLLLPYFVPFFNSRFIKNGAVSVRPFIVPMLGMISSLFINPYGVDMILMILRFFKGSRNATIAVVEMLSPSFFSDIGAILLFLFFVLVVAVQYKQISSCQLFMVLGLGFLCILNIRNIIFLPIIVVYLFGYLLCYQSFHLTQINLPKGFAIVFLIGLFGCGYICYCNYKSFENFDKGILNGGVYSDITNYLDVNADKTVRVFTNFNDGGYLEYKGYQCFIDARYEVYLDEIGHVGDYISKFVAITSGYDEKTYSYVTSDDMSAFVDEYAFDYCIATPGAFEMYLGCNPNWNCVVESGVVRLYERVSY